MQENRKKWCMQRMTWSSSVGSNDWGKTEEAETGEEDGTCREGTIIQGIEDNGGEDAISSTSCVESLLVIKWHGFFTKFFLTNKRDIFKWLSCLWTLKGVLLKKKYQCEQRLVYITCGSSQHSYCWKYRVVVLDMWNLNLHFQQILSFKNSKRSNSITYQN